MLGHELHRGGSFWSFLLSVDKDLADSSRQKGCSCGGRLHCANYPRAPRGGPDHLPEEYRCRFSFCCDRDGCRKRMTPPSVRFLGRKVYLGAVVILISAMRQGPTPRRVRELSTLFGVDRATIARWQAFWRDYIPRLRRRSYAVEGHEKSLETSRLGRPGARGTDQKLLRCRRTEARKSAPRPSLMKLFKLLS